VKLECTAKDWETHHETTYSLILDEEQLARLAAGKVPLVVKAMAEDVLWFRDQDELAAEAKAASRKRRKKTA